MKSQEILSYIQYKKWIFKTYNRGILKTYYTSVSLKMQNIFSEGDLWKKLINNLDEYEKEHLLSRKYSLITSKDPPKIVRKPFNSFIDKLYRKYLENPTELPKKRDWDWVYKQLGLMNDIIRTNIVVKYFDGVQYLLDEIATICEDERAKYEIDLKARLEGYYAGHINVFSQFEIPTVESRTIKINGITEIQVTTQVQDLIKTLLHKYYEKRRIFPTEDVNWQWNYESDEFNANYLGHILHYVEGMIVGLMEKESKGVKIEE